MFDLHLTFKRVHVVDSGILYKSLSKAIGEA